MNQTPWNAVKLVGIVSIAFTVLLTIDYLLT